MKDRIDVSSNSKISMPIFNLLGIIGNGWNCRAYVFINNSKDN